MTFAKTYLNKQKSFQLKINDEPHPDLKFIVVIPCYYEFNLLNTLDSIWKAQRIEKAIEVIVVINSSEISDQSIKEQNQITFNKANDWIAQHDDPRLKFHILNEENLPKKFAGAGLARKIGMDQAIGRFNLAQNENGIIISMDADSTVKSNYFIELEKHFTKYPKTNVVTSYFEHPVEGDEFDKGVYNAAAIYELYMRYYKLALNYSGFPYSYYTVGSCFAVRAMAYVKQGGMNRKQAGEDFYFLHKVFPLGNCHEINTTCVYPSSRPSERVPFGTGPMVKSIAENPDQEFLTYNFEAFSDLKIFLDQTENLFKIENDRLDFLFHNLPFSIGEFLAKQNFSEAIHEINGNSANIRTFTKRFFNWFDAFRILKYLNHSHENYYNKKPLISQSKQLYRVITNRYLNADNPKAILEEYRKLERKF
ncbi:MAG: glycosyltransferase [Bacteroidetes bacterium]|nr:glycosyltransferase [Bacteroidota bacterium]